MSSVYNGLPFFGGVFVLWAFESPASVNLNPTEPPASNNETATTSSGTRRRRSGDVLVAFETEIWVS